jgi:predicted ATPase
MTAVGDRLRASRLVTVTGPGGSGKTRHAVQIAFQLVPEFADGVWFVDLSAVAADWEVASAIATAVGVARSAASSQSTLDAVTQYLQSRQTLLILDNCEQAVEACARVADALLKSCADVRLLVTSRELLQIGGEATWRVEGLSVVDLDGDDGQDRGLASADVLASEAGRLFVDRAQLVQASFTLTSDNAAAVAQICRRLDGIPLALELAAARLMTLSLDQIADRLGQRFRLLTGGRTAVRRQQTLLATIDWSYDLLSEQEQALFRGVAVFAGGWNLEAAEALAGALQIPASEVLDLLSGLVAKSMVVVDTQPGAEGRSPRYRLLESIHEYAELKLVDADEAAATFRDVHLEYFVSWVERDPPAILAAGPPERIARLTLEHDNLRAALDWSRDDGSDRELRLTAAIAPLWMLRGSVPEAVTRLSGALERGSPAPSLARAEVLDWLGWYELLPDPQHAHTLFEQALAIADTLGAIHLIARASRHIVWAGDALEAPLDSLQRVLEHGLAAAHASRDARMAAVMSSDIGWLSFRQGNEQDGRRLLAESLRRARSLQSAGAICEILLTSAAVALEGTDFAACRALLEEALQIARLLGNRISAYQALMLAGELARVEGNLPAAHTNVADALRAVRNFGLQPMVLTGLRALGGCWLEMGHLERATRLFGAEAAARAGASVPSTLCPQLAQRFPIRYARDLGLARASLNVERYDVAWAEGETTPLDAALDDALDDHLLETAR